LDCALELPKESAARAEKVAAFEEEVDAVLRDPAIAIAADDRSSLYGSLVTAYEDAKNEPLKKQVANRWAQYLEQEAAAAKSPEARAVYDSHRLTAYLELKEPERAIPMLEASERDLPDDYNPPARLALAYKTMKRWNEALAASDRA